MVKWTSECINWKADIRQILCNEMLSDPHKAWLLSELIDLVIQEIQTHVVAEGNPALAAGEVNAIQFRTKAILANTVKMFLQTGDGVQSTYSLILGPGRVVDTASQRRLIADSVPLPILDDEMDFHPLCIISIVRESQAIPTDAKFREMTTRAECQVAAFLKAFVSHNLVPELIETWSDAIQERFASGNLFRTNYVFISSSTNRLMDVTDRNQSGPGGHRVRSLLSAINDWCARTETFGTVVIVQSGVDGSSSNNNTWKALRDRYPCVCLRIVMVCEERRVWNIHSFRHDPCTKLAWASFSVDRLASLWSDGRQVQNAMDREHERFLLACTLANCRKLDISLAERSRSGNFHDRLAFHYSRQNWASGFLTGCGRKSFPLHETVPRACAVCGRSDSTTWSRASSGAQSSVAVLCDDHKNDGPSATPSPVLSPIESLTHFRPHVWWSYRCNWPNCMASFQEEEGLIEHQRDHAGEKPYRCRWTACGYATSTKSTLTSHMITHSNERPFKCGWMGCEKSYKRKSYRNCHFRAHFRHLCAFVGCREGFSTTRQLQQHKLAHRGNR